MLGFLKQKVSADEFGLGVLQLAKEFLDADLARAFLSRYSDYDFSRGLFEFIASKGVTEDTFLLYGRGFTHACVQAAFTQFPTHQRLALTRGAMNGFRKTPRGYDFTATFNDLDQAYQGERIWSPTIATLSNTESKLDYLPYPSAGVVNAKYLLEKIISPNVPDQSLFFEEFRSFSGTVAASVATVTRAIMHLQCTAKIAA